MDTEKEILDADVTEKEVIDAEVLDEEKDETIESPLPSGFDPNVVLGAIMQNQDPELKNVVLKLSTLSTTTKFTGISLLICLLAKFGVYMAFILWGYSVYCAIYVLLHYNKVKENEHLIKDVMSKENEHIDIKKTVIKNLILLVAFIPLIGVAFWYWHYFIV